MAFTYTGNPMDSALDQTRFLIGDTDQCSQLLQDGEIQWVLSQYNNTPLNAAIRCCEAIMSKVTRLVDESVGQVKMSYSQRYKAYRSLRDELVGRLAVENAVPFAGGITYSQMQATASNTNRVRPDFTTQMMDNRDVSPWVIGQGWYAPWWGIS